jgi:hypothetical protein
MGVMEWFERTFFGGYTGTPAARREFARTLLLRKGYPERIVDQTMREEDARLARAGESW